MRHSSARESVCTSTARQRPGPAERWDISTASHPMPIALSRLRSKPGMRCARVLHDFHEEISHAYRT